MRQYVPALTRADEVYLALYDADSATMRFPVDVRYGDDYVEWVKEMPEGLDKETAGCLLVAKTRFAASTLTGSAPVGVKACGGPRDYVAYCVTATDTAALFRGLPFFVRSARRFSPAPDVDAVWVAAPNMLHVELVEAAIAAAAQKLLSDLQQPLNGDSPELLTSASGGVCLYPGDGSNAEPPPEISATTRSSWLRPETVSMMRRAAR